jgi:hypothetical protein
MPAPPASGRPRIEIGRQLVQALHQRAWNLHQAGGGVVDVEALEALAHRPVIGQREHHRLARRKQRLRLACVDEQPFGKDDQFVRRRHQCGKLLRRCDDVEGLVRLLGRMLKRDQLRRSATRKADHPLAMKRDRHAELMLREAGARHPQRGTHERLSLPRRLEHG